MIQSPSNRAGVSALQEAVSTDSPPTFIRKDEDPPEDIFLPPEEVRPDDTLVLGNIAVYLSGWVVRKLWSRIGCDTCRIALLSTGQSPKFDKFFTFLETKNNGGLMSPSDGVITIAMCVERHLRIDHKSYQKIAIQVMEELGGYDVLQLADHIPNTASGFGNHYFDLMKLITEAYYDVRKHHIAKIKTLQMHKNFIRHTSTKMPLFMGQ